MKPIQYKTQLNPKDIHFNELDRKYMENILLKESLKKIKKSNVNNL